MESPKPVRALRNEHVAQLHALYAGEWWSSGRSLSEVRRLIAGPSLLFGLVDESGALIAFARVVTDGVFKATLFDVIVAPAWRGRGVGRTLLDTIMSAPELSHVGHIELYCKPELVPFYRRWGFSADIGSQVLMRRDRTHDRTMMSIRGEA